MNEEHILANVAVNWTALTDAQINDLDLNDAHDAFVMLSQARQEIIQTWGVNPEQWEPEHKRVILLRQKVLDRIFELQPDFKEIDPK